MSKRKTRGRGRRTKEMKLLKERHLTTHVAHSGTYTPCRHYPHVQRIDAFATLISQLFVSIIHKVNSHLSHENDTLYLERREHGASAAPQGSAAHRPPRQLLLSTAPNTATHTGAAAEGHDHRRAGIRRHSL